MESRLIGTRKKKSWDHLVYSLIPLNILLSIHAFRESPKIGFGPIDDHEIIRFLGPDRRLEFHQIFTYLFNKTEVGEWGTSGRFRPTYYTIRLFETFLFGPNEHIWFVSRIIQVTTVSFICSLLLIELFKSLPIVIQFLIGATTSLSILSISSWPDIAMRLGPSEIFLTVGTAIFLLLSVKALLSQNTQKMWLAVLGVAILTIGTKENAIVLVPGIILLVLTSNKIVGFSKKKMVAGIFTSVVGAAISLLPIFNSLEKQTDVYGSTRDINQLIGFTFKYFGSTTGIRNLVLLQIGVLLTWLLFRKRTIEREIFFTRLYILALLSLIPFSDYVFYQASFSEPRYEILTQLSQTLIIVFVLTVVLEYFFVLQISNFASVSITLVFVCCTVFFSIAGKKYIESVKNFNEIAKVKIIGNNKFRNQISEITSTLKRGNFDNLVIVVNNVWEYEPSFSTSHFVSFDYGDIPKYLYLNTFQVSPGLEETLLDQMMDISINGSTDWAITKAPVPTQSKTLCVEFRPGPIDASICDAVITSQ